jgi:glycosyltransferase involved in cell wall biosynthesis
MKVLSVGSDRKIFEENSAVALRAVSYGQKMEALHVVVFSLASLGFREKKLSGNVTVYPTNSISKIFYVWDAIRLGKKIIRGEKFVRGRSIVTCQDPFESGLVGRRLAKKFRLPLHLQIHTDFLSPYFKNSWLNRVRVLTAKFLIPKADGLRVVSSVISDSVKKEFPNLRIKISILPVFVDIEKIENSQTFPRGKNILMASRLTREKRFDIALKVFKKVAEKIPDADLTICGSGPEMKNIKKTIENFGLSSRVELKGWRPAEAVANLFSQSFVFLLTSEYEGYGMTLIEAGAYGCPIVTTEVGVAKTDLFENGANSFVCPVGDVECLSDCLIKIFSDDEKRNLFKRRMRDSIKRIQMSKEEYINRYVGLLEEVEKTQS